MGVSSRDLSSLVQVPDADFLAVGAREAMSMESRTELMLAAWAGIVVALSVVGGLMASEFDTAIGGTPSDIVDFYESAAFDA
jgi:hypothetical protein